MIIQQLRCKTCGSTYSDYTIESDGSIYQYFHRCPPVKNPAYQPPELFDEATQKKIPNPAYKPELHANIQEYIDNPNERNENIDALKTADNKPIMKPQPVERGGVKHWLQETRIKKEGNGQIKIGDRKHDV